LIWLFLIESILICCIAVAPSIILAKLALPYFNNISSKHLSILAHWQETVAAIILLPVVIGIVAGSYPAFYLTRFNPIRVLKGNVFAGRPARSGAFSVRNILLVFQFIISISLIICSLFISNQLKFIRTTDLGFDKEDIMVISNVDKLKNEAIPFRQALASNTNVASVSVTSGLPGKAPYREFYQPRESSVSQIMLLSFVGDYDLVPTLGVKMTQGRNFSRDFQTDKDGVLLNEAAVKALGWKEPIGKQLAVTGHTEEFSVVGVMKDFHFLSLKEEITPLAIFLDSSDARTNGLSYAALKIKPGKNLEVVDQAENEWRQLTGGLPFEYSYLNDDMDAFYASDIKVSFLFNIFTAISIIIACIGLLSLTSFMVEKRSKEIGMRKVLGASVGNILLLFQKDFARLILLAFIISAPISFLIMHYWLHNFAYHITLGVLNFIVAAVLTFAIAGLTVAIVSTKVALGNPVDSLRSE
jgi:putative ABC transport system permease protein